MYEWWQKVKFTYDEILSTGGFTHLIFSSFTYKYITVAYRTHENNHILKKHMFELVQN